MPRKRRLDQCSYREGNRRCMRSGVGDPSLCSAHRVVFEQEARRAEPSPARRASEHVAGILDDFLHGRPFDPKKATSAINEFSWSLGGGYGAYSPDIGDEPQSRFDPPGDFRPPPGWFREEPPVPRIDPELVRARQQARRDLGFGPSDDLTEDLIKDRRRILARKHHPDRGGSVERMQAINDAVDVLLAALVPS